MPAVEMTPPVVASPNTCVAWSRPAQVHPPSARTVRRSGSTRMPRILPRSSTSPPSQVEKPGMLCPPPRSASSSHARGGSSSPRSRRPRRPSGRSAPGAGRAARCGSARLLVVAGVARLDDVPAQRGAQLLQPLLVELFATVVMTQTTFLDRLAGSARSAGRRRRSTRCPTPATRKDAAHRAGRIVGRECGVRLPF